MLGIFPVCTDHRYIEPSQNRTSVPERIRTNFHVCIASDVVEVTAADVLIMGLFEHVYQKTIDVVSAHRTFIRLIQMFQTFGENIQDVFDRDMLSISSEESLHYRAQGGV